MYHIKCDDYPLFDPRDDKLIVTSPKVNLEVNTVGEGSFTIYENHPYYGKLKKLKSVFEVSDEIGVIFRGRMTSNSYDFNNSTFVDLEGAMAYFNDSKVRPYSFPDDWAEDADYITAAESGNVIEFFLNWLINQHNAQVQEFQRFKLGRVTVSDPNNYLSRSDSNYPSTWDTLKSKLFDSALGGFLCIRYEADGNYIDYLSEFELTNTQEIVFGENLLDLKTDSDATETYSAIIPIGATIETESENEDGTTETAKTVVTLKNLPDGDITDDIVKEGDMIYSRSAVAEYGLIIAPVKDTTWDDVTDANNLLTKAVNFLATDGIMLLETVETTAADQHFSNEQIQSFRIYRNVKVRSAPHGHNGTYQLSKLGIDLQNPQNTKIAVGSTKRTLTDINSEKESDTIQRIESAEKDIEDNRTQSTEIRNQLIIQSTELINTCNQIIMSALETYVETSNFEEFKQTVQTQLEIMAGEITMNFTTTTEQITDVNGDFQSKFTELYKYIRFSGESAITIGSGDSTITLEIDNEKGIVFKKNGVQFGLWDGENFHTGNIIIAVNERAQFGNFAFVPRTDGSLSFLKVGG